MYKFQKNLTPKIFNNDFEKPNHKYHIPIFRIQLQIQNVFFD